MEEALKKNIQARMDGAMENLKKEFAAIRTGRASTALLDHVHIDYYGTPTKLSQAASLTVPDPRTIIIQPWEPKLLAEIEKAIMKSDLGLNPMNDGKLIRINIPPLTEERRKEYVKLAKKRGEESKVAVRNIRRDGNDQVKKLEKDKSVTEDEGKKIHDEIQKMTDAHIKKIDDAVLHKEKEIMEV